MAAAEFASLSWRRSGRSQRRDGSIFRRALGSGELQFYWDTVFNGTSITIGHLVLEAEPEYEKQIFCKENIEMAWSRMKQRFPLLAVSVEELSDSRTVEFVLDETSLRTIRRDEISFLEDLGSAEDAARLIDRLQNGPPVLTNEIIAKLMVGPQKDTPRIYHVVIVIAHYITDGVTGMTLKREFCQELTELSREGHILAEPLEKRLAAFTPIETLGPLRGRSLSRRRWRSAAAKVIYQIRQARLKGGHTLPTIRPIDPGVPAQSRTLTARLPAVQTRQILDKCRELRITFGNALPVLSQIAFARLLYKHRRESSHISGIGDAEWDHRLAQPMHFAGPLNLRPYLDRAWYDAGGASDVRMAIGSYHLVLPRMPTPKPIHEVLAFDSVISKPNSLAHWLNGQREINCYLSDELKSDTFSIADFTEDKAPSFSSAISKPNCLAHWLKGPREVDCYLSDDPETDVFSTADVTPPFPSLLSPQRFLHRARTVRAQNAAFVRHPLLHELQVVHMQKMCHRSRDISLAWRAKQFDVRSTRNDTTRSSGNSCLPDGGGHVISNGGASLGNRDLLLPLDYPLPSRSSTKNGGRIKPRLHIRDNIIHLRCRPGELYLGALTTQGQLTFFVYVDARVYDVDIVHDWMENIRAATLHYFDIDASEGRAARRDSGYNTSQADVHASLGEGGYLRARL